MTRGVMNFWLWLWSATRVLRLDMEIGGVSIRSHPWLFRFLGDGSCLFLYWIMMATISIQSEYLRERPVITSLP